MQKQTHHSKRFNKHNKPGCFFIQIDFNWGLKGLRRLASDPSDTRYLASARYELTLTATQRQRSTKKEDTCTTWFS